MISTFQNHDVLRLVHDGTLDVTQHSIPPTILEEKGTMFLSLEDWCRFYLCSNNINAVLANTADQRKQRRIAMIPIDNRLIEQLLICISIFRKMFLSCRFPQYYETKCLTENAAFTQQVNKATQARCRFLQIYCSEHRRTDSYSVTGCNWKVSKNVQRSELHKIIIRYLVIICFKHVFPCCYPDTDSFSLIEWTHFNP